MLFPKKRATICSHAVTSKFEGRVGTQSGIKLLINHWLVCKFFLLTIYAVHLHSVLLRGIKCVTETVFVLTFKKCILFLVLLKLFKNICNTWTV